MPSYRHGPGRRGDTGCLVSSDAPDHGYYVKPSVIFLMDVTNDIMRMTIAPRNLSAPSSASSLMISPIEAWPLPTSGYALWPQRRRLGIRTEEAFEGGKEAVLLSANAPCQRQSARLSTGRLRRSAIVA